MVSITVTGATITKGYKGLPAIEEIQKGIRFRIAVRDEKGGWLYHTCHIEDQLLLEKVKMMGLRAGSDIDFLASMRAVRVKEDGRTKDLSVFLIRHLEFGRPREMKEHVRQTETKRSIPGLNQNFSNQFENQQGAAYIGMVPAVDNKKVSMGENKEPSINISSLPGFLGYEVIGENEEWKNLQT